ncbi:unnamed protein product [Enterobius vermicularis]|uniref:Zinc finger protein n=1 Tax=Enterobius vermicularis TaxID=51028 RepID=A0A0N4VJH5_ENTVE|nr:unnamed protein product [Enterobius vermicularis]
MDPAYFFSGNDELDYSYHLAPLTDPCETDSLDPFTFEEVQVVKNKRKRSGDGKGGSGSETYICDYCDASFTLLHNAQAHIITYHVKGKQKKMSDRRVRYKCKKCDKLFLSPEAVKHHHNRFHSKSMKQCTHCDKQYKSQSCLQEHINSIHLNLRPFVCDQCSAAFGHKCVLRRHYMIKHLNFEYRCPYKDCTHPGFKCSKAVTAHIRSVHTHVRPYPCSICGLRFVRRNDMVVHKKCHSNKYDHECPECGKCFRQKTNLRSHMKKIHKESTYVI